MPVSHELTHIPKAKHSTMFLCWPWPITRELEAAGLYQCPSSLYTQIPNESSHCAWVLLRGHSLQTLAGVSHSSPEHSRAVPRHDSREQSCPVEHVQLPTQPGSAGRDSSNKAPDQGELRHVMWHQDDTQVSVLKDISRQ